MKSCENQLRLQTLIEYGVYYLLSAVLVFLEIKKIGIVAAIEKAKTMLPPEVTLVMLIGIGIGTVGLVEFEPFRNVGKIFDIIYGLVRIIVLGLMVYALWLFCM